MAEHTKGPWTFYYPDSDQWTRFDKDRPDRWASLMAGEDTILTFSTIDGEGLIECSPVHARLIAKSPELLAACEKLAAIRSNPGDAIIAKRCRLLASEARALIAEIEGA